MTFHLMGERGLGASAGGCPSVGGQHVAKISQAALESIEDVGVDRWLSFGIAARWLGPRFLGLVNAERCVQQAIRIGRARVLGHKQQHAPVRRLEDSEQAPYAVQVKPADPRQGFASQPDTCRRASAAAYVLDS